MTLAAVWFDPADFLHAAADSRIRHEHGVLTEHGPKLLSLPVMCLQPGPAGFFNSLAHHSVFGFAYAGATLPALSTHSLASTVCAHLIGEPGAPAPALHEVAILVGHIAAGYMREVGAIAQRGAFFEAVLFGWCPQLARFRVIIFKPDLHHSPLKVRLEAIEMVDATSLVAIGTGIPNFLQIVERRRQSEGARSRIPLRALEEMIAAESEPNVGGSIQQGYCNRESFRAVATPRRLDPQQSPNFVRTVLGYDMDADFPAIGHYRFSMQRLF
jgi:hypothetical protein